MSWPSALVDTGPLVAALSPRDTHHAWAVAGLGRLGPGVTCEAVLSETAFLVARNGGEAAHVVDIVRRGALAVVPVLADHADRVAELMRIYADLPMALADACLVVLVEQNPGTPVFTVDRDFLVYRVNRNERFPILAPFAV